jgi:hypothetical protein
MLSLFAAPDQADPQASPKPPYSFAQEIAAKNKEIKEEYLKLANQQPSGNPKPSKEQPDPNKDKSVSL